MHSLTQYLDVSALRFLLCPVLYRYSSEANTDQSNSICSNLYAVINISVALEQSRYCQLIWTDTVSSVVLLMTGLSVAMVTERNSRLAVCYGTVPAIKLCCQSF